MKLVRITTEDRNANFSNNFNEDIIIEKDSQICVNTVSMEVDTTDVIINSNNDNIFWKFLVTGTERRITLTHTAEGNPYNNNNFNILLSDITNKLNASLSPDGIEIGRQWRCAVNAKNKISIENKQADYTDRGDMFKANVPVKVLPTAGGDAQSVMTVAPSATGTKCNQVAGEAVKNSNFSMTYSNHSITKGCGIFRVKLNNIVDTNADVLKQGFIIGVAKTSPSSYIDSRSMTDADMSFAIHLSRTDAPYAKIIDGVRTALVHSVNFKGIGNVENDVLEVQISLGKLKLILYSDTKSVPTILHEVDYDGVTAFYPFIVMRGTSTTIANIKKTTTDPFFDPPLGITSVIEDYDSMTVKPPTGTTRSANAFIRFDDSAGDQLSEFLGFTSPRFPVEGNLTARQLDFEGQLKFNFTDLSDAFVVMMDNIRLLSYDGFSQNKTGGGRQNIICIIPKSDSDNTILYEPNNNNWLDMDNADKITLRQIKARILKNDLSPLVTNGLSTITFFIRPKTESN